MTFSEWKISNDLKLFPYLLKKESHNLMPKKRLKDYSISNIVYDWARLERPAAKPKDLPSLMIENYSRSRQVRIFLTFEINKGKSKNLIPETPIFRELYDYCIDC